MPTYGRSEKLLHSVIIRDGLDVDTMTLGGTLVTAGVGATGATGATGPAANTVGLVSYGSAGPIANSDPHILGQIWANTVANSTVITISAG